MKTPLQRFLILVTAAALLGCFGLAMANDVDGPDCLQPRRDFGDAPDGIDAYPGVAGHFPTCIAAGSPAGLAETTCPAISSAPGAANGFVRHETPAGIAPYWLGCSGVAAPGGIDGEDDGKVNLVGVGASDCNAAWMVDNSEPSWFNFGQDESYGDTDAGVLAPVSFTVCQSGTVTFEAFNCGVARPVILNVLVDWNEDGDWNDNFECPGFPALTCGYEWAVKNASIMLPPGCTSITSPAFLAGPKPGRGWMRITITDNPVPNDYPWNGSAGLATQTFAFGETEDYPVRILPGPGDACTSSYQDWGDAPEDLPAYGNGVVGQFPTCLAAGGVATLDLECGTPSGPLPGPAGFVRHDVTASDPIKFWLGCPSTGFSGVDSEIDGKVNHDPPMGLISHCNLGVTVDGFEPSWFNFGQDESYGDADAGILGSLTFAACDVGTVSYSAFNCMTLPHEVNLNILVDWNEDGDWVDNILCPATGRCAPEWAVRNVLVPLNPGCNILTSPSFLVGGHVGQGWLRITLTDEPVPNDFPWNGSKSTASHAFSAGETEDYPVRIAPSLDVGDLTHGETMFAPAVPNPARLSTVLRWSQSITAPVSLSIFDIVGRKRAQLVDRVVEPGTHQVEWSFRATDGSDVAPGMYVAKLRIGEQEFTTRVIRTR